MKKFTRFCIITGLVLLVPGVTAMAAASSLGGTYPSHYRLNRVTQNLKTPLSRWDDEHCFWDDDEWEHHERWRDRNNTSAPNNADVSYSDIKNLEIDVLAGKVEINRSDSVSEVTVHIPENQGRSRYYIKENTLKVESKAPSSDNNVPAIQVLVPEDFHFAKVEVDADLADCTLTDISADRLELGTERGNISYSGSVTGTIDAEADAGSIQIKLKEAQGDYRYQAECGSGNIVVGSETISARSEKRNLQNGAPYLMELECESGNIDVQFSNTGANL